MMFYEPVKKNVYKKPRYFHVIIFIYLFSHFNHWSWLYWRFSKVYNKHCWYWQALKNTFHWLSEQFFFRAWGPEWKVFRLKWWYDVVTDLALGLGDSRISSARHGNAFLAVITNTLPHQQFSPDLKKKSQLWYFSSRGANLSSPF